jgi:hypothetical protein|tara:strand:- start:30 stop:224 length:195 start_codon:yes stop_codon:yes gene_type:complete
MIEIKLTDKEFKMLKYILTFVEDDALTAEHLSDLLDEPVSDEDLNKLYKNLSESNDLKKLGYIK